ncbi:MAG: hypothetical protein ACLT33_10495 [Lachnospira pectinoschiza]
MIFSILGDEDIQNVQEKDIDVASTDESGGRLKLIYIIREEILQQVSVFWILLYRRLKIGTFRKTFSKLVEKRWSFL